MSILDEKEPTVSLKLIVFLVSLLAFGAIGSLFVINGSIAATAHHAQSVDQKTL